MNTRNMDARNSRPGFAVHCGFTIVELLVSVVIVAILASAAFPMAELARQRSKEQELRHALLQIREAIDAYKRAGDDGKVRRTADASGYPTTLEDLVAGVPDVSAAKGGTLYFLRRLPRDPTFPDRNAPAAETWGKRSYASSAEAPHEGVDVYDIYSLSEGVGLNGLAFKEW